MNRAWAHRKRALRQWLGLCLVVLLAFAPPLNLAHGNNIPDRIAETHGKAGHDNHKHSGAAHDAADASCLQCIALGGMTLAGATPAPVPAPGIAPQNIGWLPGDTGGYSRAACTPVCRGPPALA